MRFKIPGLRRAGVAAVAAVTVGTAFAMIGATPASAASPPTGGTAWTGPPPAPAGINAASQPAMVAGTTNSAAGVWSIEVDAGTFAAGDTILVQLDDNNSAETADVNCNSATDFVAFHGTPTVSVVSAAPASGVAGVTASLSASAPCTANTRSDIMKLTFTNGSNTFPQQLLTVSNVNYDSGTAVAPGPVTVTAAGCAAADVGCLTPGAFTGSGGAASNAVIATAFATANNPPVATLPATAGQAISNVVITEVEPAGGGILPTGTFVCVTIKSPGSDDGGSGEPQWTATAVPTVTAGDAALVNNGIGGTNGSTASATFDANGNEPDPVVASGNPADAFGFMIAQGSSTATTYTISGLKIDTSTSAGPVNVGVGTGTSFRLACDNAETSTPNLGVVTATVIVSSSRIGGADRYGTAAALFSPFGAACGTNGLNAVLARGDLFADSLAANYLAGSLNNNGIDDAIQGTGILLTTPNALPDVTLAALRNAGVTDVFIVGQTNAVSTDVENQLKATPAYNCGGANQLVLSAVPQFLKVTRIGGATRYDTAQLIAQTPNPSQVGTADLDGDTTPNPLKTGIVATGTNFPDALAAGPMAFWGNNASNIWFDVGNDDAVSNASTPTVWGTGLGANGDHCCGNPRVVANGFPLVLTDPSSLSSQAQAALLNDGIQQVILMGGTLAISTNVETQLTALGIKVIRLAGADRSDTAAKAAALETGTFSDLPTGTVEDTANANCDADAASGATCSKPVGLFYRTDHINLARGDNAGAGADALAGGPHAAGLDGSGVLCDDIRPCTGDNDEDFEGPTPILLTQDPATLATATHDYLAAHSTPKADASDEGPTPDGGLITIDVFGQTVAVSNATQTAAVNALTGV